MKRLWVQQTLAFGVVVIVTMAAVAIWINRTAGAEFRKYITVRDVPVPGSAAQELLEHYQWHGSWEGVGRLLAEGVYIGSDGVGIVLGRTTAEGGQGKRKIPDILLADADARVVYDSSGKLEGKRLSRGEQRYAWPIAEADDAEPVGSLLLYFPVSKPEGTIERQFLDRVGQILVIGAVSAVVLILVVAALLNRRLNAPLQRLAAAARTVAAGDLGRKVETGGSTEITDVGQAFNEMTAELERAEVLRQNMVADVAHELRTPLSVLQGNLWAILNDAYPLEKAEVSRLYDETRVLSRLVEDLRELALADSGHLHLDRRPTDVAQVIRQTVDNLGLAAEAEEVILTAQLPEDLPTVRADPDRVAQVLRNLLVNAVRHTPPGSSVTVSASPKIGTLEIAVADTGEGIAPEDLPHVFERFWRADAARARSGDGGEERLAGGSGLGLSVAQSLVKAQGGRIWVESAPGEGTVLKFTLPVVERDD